jgi:hypothetical protein
LTGIYFWGLKNSKKKDSRGFLIFPVFSRGFFHRNVVLEGVSGIPVFAAFTGFFCRNSCGTRIPVFTTDSSGFLWNPPDSFGFLRIPVPAKCCLALARD